MAVLDTLASYINDLGAIHYQLILDYNDRWIKIEDLTKKLRKMVRHYHAAHEHRCCHTYDGEISTKNYGTPYFFKCEQNCHETKFYPDHTLSLTELLLMEHSLERDCDENKILFMKDFLFNPKDDNVPKVLKAIQRLAIRKLFLPRYNWSDYIGTVPVHLGLKDFLK